MNLGPDEAIYAGQASAVREYKFKAFRLLAESYVKQPALSAYPSPLRWLWLVAMALTRPHYLQVASWVALGPLAVWAMGLHWWALIWVYFSPLAALGGKRLLQDVPIAALTLTSLGFALHGNALGLVVSLFVLLSCKEAAVFTVPALALAWWFGPGTVALGAVSLALAGVLWLTALFLIFGNLTVPMFRAARNGHATDYTRAQQKGAAHRLLIDLVLLSPVAVCSALWVHNLWVVALTAALLAAHTIAPVRNIRLVLAADLLLRCTVLPLWMLPLALVADLYIIRHVRHVYDPVTQFLTDSLGMSRPSQA